MRISDWSSDVCSSDLTNSRGDPGRQPPQLGTRGGQRDVDCIEAGDDPLDISVDDGRRQAERDRGDCAGGIGADPGEREQHRFVAREMPVLALDDRARSEEHPSELQSLMRISYAVFCLKKKTK